MTEPQPFKLEELRPAQQLKHYRFLEQIGVGGQAVVWSALDELHQQVVAIKLSEPTQAEAAVSAAAFEKLAAMGASFHHPHILPLNDFGALGNVQYMVTPYLSGGSLQEWLHAERLSNEVILRVATEIVSALDYLHRQRIVHRDLKPGNVLLNLNRHVYLADFGLARLTSDTTQALHTGRGTPQYAPPEQHSQAQLTPQSDIFSLGIVLYEMFTGQLPWQGQKTLGIQQLHSSDELPDLVDTAPEAPFGLLEVLRTFTAADAHNRPQNVLQALDMLREVLGVPHEDQVFELASPVAPVSEPFDEAQSLLAVGLADWSLFPSQYPYSFTKFLIIHLGLTGPQHELVGQQVARFMLAGALSYDYQVEFWWGQIAEPAELLAVCAALIENARPVVIETILAYLFTASGPRWDSLYLPPSVVSKLIDLATTTEQPVLTSQILRVLFKFTAPASAWREVAFGPLEDLKLARLAVADLPYAPSAARLIGRVRSKTTLQQILGDADETQRLPLLVVIQQTAGTLPNTFSRPLRARVLAEALLSQITAAPRDLATSFGLTLLGSFLAFGLYAYITYRLPEFLDSTRLLISIERGLFLGVPVAIGLVLIRAVMQRWLGFRWTVRVALATVAGGLLVTASFWLYSFVILDLPPQGWLIPAGSGLIAIGFALSASLGRGRAIGLSLVAFWSALVGAWFLGKAMGLSPLFDFEMSWSVGQVGLLCGTMALLQAVGANLISLREPG